MQFRVPQNIAMEDKIVGPLTAIQFGIAVVGGTLAFIIFTSSSLPKPLAYGGGGLIALITAALSLGRFNDQPLYRFSRFVVAFVITPRVRIWRKDVRPEPILISKAPHHAGAHETHRARAVSKAELAGLAAVLDSRGREGAPPPVPMKAP